MMYTIFKKFKFYYFIFIGQQIVTERLEAKVTRGVRDRTGSQDTRELCRNSTLTSSRDYSMYYTKYIAHNKSFTSCKYLAVVDLFLPSWLPSCLCSALWKSVYMSLSTSSAFAWRPLEGRNHVYLFCITLSIKLYTWNFIFIDDDDFLYAFLSFPVFRWTKPADNY